MAVEKRRGCGYRKVGGLYLVGITGIWVPCDRLPILLEKCPTCSGGIKPGLGFAWISPKGLLEGDHLKKIPLDNGYDSTDGPCGEKDILCLNPPDRAGLMWVGSKFYTPHSFINEAREMGASKRIPAIPKGFVVGETWVVLAHRQATTKNFEEHEFEGKNETCKHCGMSKYNLGKLAEMNDKAPCPRKMPAIFSAFKPDRIEKLVDDDTPQKEIEDLEKRGITVVKVPKSDRDHHGNVYDEEEKGEQIATEAIQQ